MTRLYLLRHAEAALAPGQPQGSLFSTGDTPLSPRGRLQAEAVAARLADEGIGAVHASPAKRTRETAGIIGERLGLPVAVHAGLHELPVGRRGEGYEMMLARILALAAALETEEDPVLADGSRLSSHRERFRGALARIAETSTRPIVVAHGLVNRVYLVEVLGLPPHQLLELDQAHASVTVVELGPSGARLVPLDEDPRAPGER